MAEATWNFTITFFDQVIKGTHSITAGSEHHAIRMIVFRVMREQNPHVGVHRPLVVASRIIENQLYRVDRKELMRPIGLEIPQPHSAVPPVQEPDKPVADDINTIQRGLGKYPENPDEPEED